MKSLQRVRPLYPFLVIWFGFIGWQSAAHLSQWAFDGLLFGHFGLYFFAEFIKIKNIYHKWGYLLGQGLLVGLITQVSQDALLAFGLTLTWFIICVDLLKEIRYFLPASGAYFALFLLFSRTLGSEIRWEQLWKGDTRLELVALFVVVSMMLYLQQEYSHWQTQHLLSELKASHAQLATAHTQLAAYSQRVEELTTLSERQRIARDLHDTLVQGVTAIVMQLEVASNQLQQGRIERTQTILEQTLEAARDALADTRFTLSDLRGAVFRPDELVDDVQEEISRFTATTGIKCHSDIALIAILPSALCEHTLRVISEALTNVSRHSQAGQVWIEALRLPAYPGMLTIEVRDDGCGFNQEKVNKMGGHYGLLGIKERTRLIGGTLEIRTSIGTGTTLRLQIPEKIAQGDRRQWPRIPTPNLFV